MLVEGSKVWGTRISFDPTEAAAACADAGADEIGLVSSGAGLETLTALTRRIAASLRVPLLVLADHPEVAAVDQLIEAGADRVFVQASALHDPGYIAVLARAFGGESVGVVVTAQREGGGWRVLDAPGGLPTEWDAVTWSSVVKAQGCREIVLSTPAGGAHGEPVDLELLSAVTSALELQVVAAGEVDTVEDILDALMIGNADGALVGSLLHSGKRSVRDVKKYLAEHGLRVRH